MKQLLLSGLLLATATLPACRKDPTPAPPEEEYFPEYLPLKTGNYWVYRLYDIDIVTGQVTPLARLDSCFIQKDTVVRGTTYAKFVRPAWFSYSQTRLLRDSLHYLVDQHGKRLFSSQTVDTPLDMYYLFNGPNDTLVKASSSMVDQNLAVTVPAGTYLTTNYQTFFQYYPNNQVPFSNTRIMNARYAENIGIVVETHPFYLGQFSYTERRLLRYHLN